MKTLFLVLLSLQTVAQSIRITAPTSGQSIPINANFTFTVNVTGNVKSVTYWIDNWSWIGEVTQAPYALNWFPNVASGNHVLKARVTFTNNSVLDAAEVAFVVLPPPVQPPTEPMKIGTNFWFMAPWSGETPFKSGINWTTAYATNADVWNPTFIAELQPYSSLRFMDWGSTNNSAIVSWSQRRLPTDPNNPNIDANNDSTLVVPGLAYEWMIDLCNRTNKDMWVCVPHKADPNYWTQLATLIAQKLNSNRKVYVEYSNETWNGSFAQYNRCIEHGVALNLPGENQWYKGGAYALWQSLKIFNAFQAVFGAGQMGSRVIRVFAASGNYDIAAKAFANVHNSPTWNVGQKVDMFAIAPYVGSELDGSSAGIQSLFHTAIDQVFTERILPALTIANNNGTLLGCYEGGQHLLLNAHLWSANSLIYNEYLYMLDKWKPKFSLFMHYTHAGTWSSTGAWGAKNATGQPMAQAHKYRAIVDWNTANNCPSTLERSGTETGTGVYKTSQTISAPPTGQTNVISAASNVLYQAGSSVLLKPGFRADKGSVFYAVIRGCD
jgi:hypothetical protein